jgi:signal transduction histidine kinase
MQGMNSPFAARERVSILLVDDQPARLMSYESILGDLGQNLVCARSGIEALERLMKEEFAVVLLDVSMPGMDGFETASLIHQHPRFERTPIIFVTGVHISELDRLKGYKLGAVDYVSIPVVPEILRSKVAVLVELHCQRRELQKLNTGLAEANAHLALANSTLQAEKNRELELLNTNLQTANTELEHAIRALQSEVAERARAELALKEADRHKDEFLATLAHELRNPLAPIRNAVDIMTRLPLENPKLVWARDAIGRQAGHLTRLVDDLLDVSRITRGRINLTKEPLAIGPLLMRAIETVQPSISARGHELRVECPDERLMIDGDQTRLIQVLGNVLSNAAKYTPPGGRIEVLARRKLVGGAPQLEIRVRDNGIGIATESLPRLFNLFSQLDTGDRRSQNGLGIGLALVRRLVEMHAGEVSVHSAGTGQGSEFTIHLPLLENATQAIAEPTVVLQEQSGPRRRILLADDNQDALEGLAALLEHAGHEVCKAADGAQAIELAARWRPELAVLDIGMPQLSGYEVAQRIRSEGWGRDIVLVALSGWGQSEDLRRSRESGFDLHLVKPVSFDSLSELVASLPAR